jgi:hypothetical protein
VAAAVVETGQRRNEVLPDLERDVNEDLSVERPRRRAVRV